MLAAIDTHAWLAVLFVITLIITYIIFRQIKEEERKRALLDRVTTIVKNSNNLLPSDALKILIDQTTLRINGLKQSNNNPKLIKQEEKTLKYYQALYTVLNPK